MSAIIRQRTGKNSDNLLFAGNHIIGNHIIII